MDTPHGKMREWDEDGFVKRGAEILRAHQMPIEKMVEVIEMAAKLFAKASHEG